MRFMKYQDFLFYFKTRKGSVNGGSIAKTSRPYRDPKHSLSPTQHGILRETNFKYP